MNHLKLLTNSEINNELELEIDDELKPEVIEDESEEIDKSSKAKKKSKIKSESSLRNSFGLLVLIAMGFSITSIVFQLILLLFSWNIANKPAPTLVQLATGESISVTPIGSHDRSPETVQKFVQNIMTMTFNWSGTVPNPETGAQIPDNGISIKTEINGRSVNRRITTPAYESLFAFELGFRQEFMTTIATLTPEAIFNQKGQVAFIPVQISTPQRVGQGQWKIILISNLLFLRQGQPVGNLVGFNKEIYVRAVDPPSINALPEEMMSGSLAETIAKIRASGLEITAISDYRSQDLITE
jgi:hypothetical protein